MAKNLRGKSSFNYVDDRLVTRLCLRPERKPGVAPDCEDAREAPPRHKNTEMYINAQERARVTLPKCNWLDRVKDKGYER